MDYQAFGSFLKDSSPDFVTVSCANWLGTQPHDESSNKFRADLLESINCPIVCFGLGTQAPHGATTVSLGPESQRLAKVLASKAEQLSVRDKLTESVLRELGISNARVTGCPSNFINLQPNLGQRVAKQTQEKIHRDPTWDVTRVVVSEFSGGHKASGPVLQRLFQILDNAPAFYVAQSPELLKFICRESTQAPRAYQANTSYSPNQCARILNSTALAFSSVDAWLDFCRSCDLSLGMRIHGTMVALQAQVPSILIGHDSRTSGLAAEMAIPCIDPECFLELSLESPLPFLELFVDQIRSYDDTRAKLATVWSEFLLENGLTPSPGLRLLADR